MNDGGKGSSPRPFSVNDETFKQNFEAIFGKKHDKNSPSTERALAQTGSKRTTETEGPSSGMEEASS